MKRWDRREQEVRRGEHIKAGRGEGAAERQTETCGEKQRGIKPLVKSKKNKHKGETAERNLGNGLK